MNTTVGVFATHKQAEDTINELRAFGVTESDLSYVYMDVHGEMKDDISKVGVGAAAGATAGAVIGAVAGLVVANVILPGFGSVFVAGPLAAALGITGTAATAVAGAGAGIAAGGLLGGLSSMGIADADTTLYQSFVERGEVLVVAKSQTLSTKGVFEKGGATEIREYIIV